MVLKQILGWPKFLENYYGTPKFPLYISDECAVNTDACLFGICNDLVNDYSCSCNGIFSGDRCQNSPNFCESNNNCLGNVCYNSIDDQDARCHCEGLYFVQSGWYLSILDSLGLRTPVQQKK